MSYIQRLQRGMVLVLAMTIFLHTTHLSELSKAPFVFIHYSDHHQRHPQDSFRDFLYKHYIQDQKAESEQDRNSDSHLPFKAHTFHFDLSVFDPTARSIQPVINALFEPALFPATKSPLLSRSGENWNPPKIG